MGWAERRAEKDIRKRKRWAENIEKAQAEVHLVHGVVFRRKPGEPWEWIPASNFDSQKEILQAEHPEVEFGFAKVNDVTHEVVGEVTPMRKTKGQGGE